MTEYQDINGTPCSLDALCVDEPGWAANRIRAELAKNETLSAENGDLETENQSLADRNWRLTEKIVRSVSHFDARSELHTNDHDCLLTIVALLRSVDPRAPVSTQRASFVGDAHKYRHPAQSGQRQCEHHLGMELTKWDKCPDCGQRFEDMGF